MLQPAGAVPDVWKNLLLALVPWLLIMGVILFFFNRSFRAARAARGGDPGRSPLPDGTTSDIYPSLCYEDAPAAIDWLCRAFGFTQRLVVPGPNGTIRHSELSYGNGVIMVGSPRADRGFVSPRRQSGLSQALSVCVDDADAHHDRAKAAGAVIVQPLRDEEFGARGYMARDPEGHVWYFATYRPGAHWGAPPAQHSPARLSGLR